MQHLKGHLSVGVRGMCLRENTLILNFNKNYKMLSVTYTLISITSVKFSVLSYQEPIRTLLQ